jgi:hypothetical protein
MLETKTNLVVLPQETYLKMQRGIDDIQLMLKNQNLKNQIREWVPRLEFMERCNISTTQYHIFDNKGLLRKKNVGKKIFVHCTCIDQYFNGDFH